MADGTHIEWTDATWNPVTGCSVVSPGCTNCYAMKLAGTRLQDHPSRAGLTKPSKAGPAWTGEVRFNDGWLDQPLRWKRSRRIFVCAHADLFHENVPDEWIDKVFAVMTMTPQHQFQVLTKRSARMRNYMVSRSCRFPARGVRPNVWLGVSVEDQARADERIPDLLATLPPCGGSVPSRCWGRSTLNRIFCLYLNGQKDGSTIIPTSFPNTRSTGLSSVVRAAPARGLCTRIGRGPCATSAQRQGCTSSTSRTATGSLRTMPMLRTIRALKMAAIKRLLPHRQKGRWPPARWR